MKPQQFAIRDETIRQHPAARGELNRLVGRYRHETFIGEFLDLYSDIRLKLLLTEQELDLGMREADVALRLRQPEQGDLIQRRLFTVHFHIYASPDYIKRFGQPRSVEEIDRHRIITFGGTAGSFIQEINWLNTGRDGGIEYHGVTGTYSFNDNDADGAPGVTIFTYDAGARAWNPVKIKAL